MNLRAALALVAIVGNGGLVLANSQRATVASPAKVATDTARVPPTLVRARTAFLINEAPGRATDREFSELRAQLRRWDHFDLVDRANRADVTISLRTSQVEHLGAESAAPIGARFVRPTKVVVRSNVSTLTVRQRSTGEILWSGENGTVTTVLQRLQKDMPPGPTICFVFWCR